MAQSRYSRQEVIPQIGKLGQQKLKQSTVAIVGVGALGTGVSELLARAGIGKLILIDHDVVDLSNLQRQQLFFEKNIGKPKASSAKKQLEKINSEIEIIAYDKHLNYETIDLIKADFVVDCTDNLDTRFLINEYCTREQIFWVHGAVLKEKGVLYVVSPMGPCFNCIFPNVSQGGSCEEFGILGATTTIISSLQANEIIKLIVGIEPESALLRLDVLKNQIDKIKVKKNSNCAVCKGSYVRLEGLETEIEGIDSNDSAKNSCNNNSCINNELAKKDEFTIQKCKTKAGWSAKPTKQLKLNLNNIKKKFKLIMDTPILIVIEKKGEIIVHNYGELLFKDLKDEQEIKKIAKEIYLVGK
ncbi:HesA/MoeB/ThiF family protein [Candidatus Woesearchaeota archaeon]|jgi:molybdopterin-synthase adenylyltransferase|nr:HesA/MoeB/ThiF family protein [Candidatus Woesearchaeota archaeon]